jgi:hypothetical protein
MKVVFADTFYFLALLNRRDPFHERVVSASRTADLSILTTEFVLLELADALCKPPQRQEVLAVCRLVETNAAFRLVRATADLLQRGRKLYEDRPDKEWQLTDCISFVVMQDEGVGEALTGDRHFEQAGFKALLVWKTTPASVLKVLVKLAQGRFAVPLAGANPMFSCAQSCMGSACAGCERLLRRRRNVEPLARSDCHPPRLLPH